MKVRTHHDISKLLRAHVDIAQKRRLLASAAAAGISVAFGSPLGGVLFGLEELDTFANDSDVIWRAFVTSVIAAVSLQYINPFGTSKLVLFQVSSISDTWRAFELVNISCRNNLFRATPDYVSKGSLAIS